LGDASPGQVGNAREVILRLVTDPEIRDVQRNLPRKHKISVAWANEAGAQTLMNCQGWVPVERDGTVGWKFHAGGGLGARPHLAKVIFDWVPDELVLPVARATIEAFRRHGDRRQRAFARLKVVVDRLGASGFADVVLDILRERGVPGVDRLEVATSPTPSIGRAFLDGQESVPQRQAGLNVVRVMVPRSELKCAEARILARWADEFGGGKVGFTNRQNLELHDVPDASVPALLDALHAAGFRTRGHERLPDIVACVGTTMCKMAVSDTPDAYRRLYAAFAMDETYWQDVGPLRINITGCPNNCAHSWIADIGLRGRRSRGADGGSVEGYTVLVGGKLSEAGRIAEPLCDVAATEIVATVRRILDTYLQHRSSAKERFVDFCERVDVGTFRELMS
jgi:sulfite reductase beta subunit-like hemoprotein